MAFLCSWTAFEKKSLIVQLYYITFSINFQTFTWDFVVVRLNALWKNVKAKTLMRMRNTKTYLFSQKPILSVSQIIGLDLVDNWRKFNKTTRIHFFPYWFWCFFSNKQIIKFLWEWNNRACFSRAIVSQWSTDINNVVNN